MKNEKWGRKNIYLGIMALLLCGCSRVSAPLLIMDANFQNARGMYTQAISAYTRAIEYPQAAPYAEFGLGSVYSTLGEDKAALERFAEAARLMETHDPDTGKELRYRIHYNTGVVLFSGGDFAGAANAFRQALTVDGGKKDAKRNLELSIRSLERSNRANGTTDSGEPESMAALFAYIQQKERSQWKSREWQQEEDTGELDY